MKWIGKEAGAASPAPSHKGIPSSLEGEGSKTSAECKVLSAELRPLERVESLGLLERLLLAEAHRVRCRWAAPGVVCERLGREARVFSRVVFPTLEGAK